MLSRMIGKLADETPIDYLRRAVSHLDWERESTLNQMPSVDALLEYFGLFESHGNGWEGILGGIAEGNNPEPVLSFIRRHKLGEAWLNDANDAIRESQKTT